MLLQALLTSMIACWAIRLGSFLVWRVHKQGGDSRFDEAKHKPLTFWVYWTMQVRGRRISETGNAQHEQRRHVATQLRRISPARQ
jgi:hypothetical protein